MKINTNLRCWFFCLKSPPSIAHSVHNITNKNDNIFPKLCNYMCRRCLNQRWKIKNATVCINCCIFLYIILIGISTKLLNPCFKKSEKFSWKNSMTHQNRIFSKQNYACFLIILTLKRISRKNDIITKIFIIIKFFR